MSGSRENTMCCQPRKRSLKIERRQTSRDSAVALFCVSAGGLCPGSSTYASHHAAGGGADVGTQPRSAGIATEPPFDEGTGGGGGSACQSKFWPGWHRCLSVGYEPGISLRLFRPGFPPL